MTDRPDIQRSLGLLGATGVGVGAIVGGGVLALAGVAFAATGPSAIVAFALNGVIAALTALSFAELATQFPESGGTYAFAKKILTVEAAFIVGWVVWFASIVAGVLYTCVELAREEWGWRRRRAVLRAQYPKRSRVHRAYTVPVSPPRRAQHPVSAEEQSGSRQKLEVSPKRERHASAQPSLVHT